MKQLLSVKKNGGVVGGICNLPTTPDCKPQWQAGAFKRIVSIPVGGAVKPMSLGNHEFIGVKVPIKVIVFNDLYK